MKIVNRVTLAWVLIPILYTGCVESNISQQGPSRDSNIAHSSTVSDINRTIQKSKAEVVETIPTVMVDESSPLVQDELLKNSLDVPKAIPS